MAAAALEWPPPVSEVMIRTRFVWISVELLNLSPLDWIDVKSPANGYPHPDRKQFAPNHNQSAPRAELGESVGAVSARLVFFSCRSSRLI